MIGRFLGGVFLVFMFIVLLLGLTWIGQGNEFFLYQYFAPRFEQVRRDVFEQTKSYRQGMIQDLQRSQEEYILADDAHKDALASIILHRSADFPEEEMPPDLQAFIHQLKRDRHMVR